MRNANTNEVLDVRSEKLVWNQMWDGNKWSGQIPWLPDSSGYYVFSVLINSQLVCNIRFTMTE